jgi:hypothetical protein
MNYRIIGADGRQYGPATTEQIKEWIASGRANGQTQVQAEGSVDWKPLANFPEFAEALAAKAAAAPAPQAPAPQAPAPFPGPAPSAAPAVQEADFLARDYEVSIGSCLSRSWDLLMKNFWLLLGATLVLGLIEGTVGFLAGVCAGGGYFLFLKLIRGERAEFGDAFAGFSLAFLQLFLAGLVVGLLASVGLVCCILPGIYLIVAWTFAVPLVIDKKMEFWPAMELSRKMVHKHWWVLFGLHLVNFLVILLGFCLCCVGAFVAQPLILGALAYAYEDIFGKRSAPAA